MANDPALRAAALESKAWPYEEARKLLKRYPDGVPAKGHVLFETGYGPSGLPHIGTFNEVLRTTMVQHAFEATLDARVGERTRIARELHDTLLQSFHGLLLMFQTVSYLLPARPTDAREQLDCAI